MSLLLNQPSKLCFRKPVLVRSSPHLSNGPSSLEFQTQSRSFVLIGADPCGGTRGIARIQRTEGKPIPPLKDGVLRLREVNLNHGTDPKRISLPPLVTLPHCQTQYVTNVAMSSSSLEEEDCVVAVKFLGPQLSFCRPARSNSEWINIRVTDPCFFSSPVMFSKNDDMFRIAGSGGHLIGSWDLHKPSENPKLQILRFQNLPEMSKTKRDLLDSCYTSEHLVDSITTSETFLVKLYEKTEKIIKGIPRKKTEAIMLFKLDKEGNAVYTQDIGDQSIYVTKSEAVCVPLSSFLCFRQPNFVKIFDVDERRYIKQAEQMWDC